MRLHPDMRFACHTCHTRYSLPDEKAHGRLLKVRCKKCGTVLFLKPPLDTTTTPVLVTASPTSDEITRETAAVDTGKLHGPTRPASIESSEWYAIVAGVQLGPIAFSAFFQRMTLGQIDARTYVWRDSMGAWKRVEAMPELVRLLPRIAPEPAARSTRTIELPAVPSISGARATPAASSPRTPDFGSHTPSTVAASPTARARSSATPRRESSAMQLDRAPAGEELEDASSSIEDGWHSSPVPAGSDPLANVPDAHSFSPVSRADSTRFVIARGLPERSPWPRALALGGVVIVLLGGSALLLARLGAKPRAAGQQGGPQAVFNEDGTDDPNLRRALAGHRPSRPQPAPSGGGAVRSVGSGSTVRETEPAPTPIQKEERHVETLADRDKERLAKLYAGGKELQIKAQGAQTPVVDSPNAPLTAQQVAATVAHYQNGYNVCVDRELKRNPNFRGGKIRIVTTITSSGLVRQAQIQSDDERLARSVAGGLLGNCLTEQTRRMVFPNFAGEPFDAEIPLVLGATF
jgi:predicted Zn finger-like uncharacterized protein